MVKKLDDKQWPPLLDHVGWRLWRAKEEWERRFKREMVAAGHTWFAEARANLVPYIGRGGARQSELAAQTGMSKQAVQQFIDELVEDGIVERQPDPDDARAKRVVFTRAGLAMLADANTVKLAIERDYRNLLGETAFEQLNAALDRLLGAKE